MPSRQVRRGWSRMADRTGHLIDSCINAFHTSFFYNITSLIMTTCWCSVYDSQHTRIYMTKYTRLDAKSFSLCNDLYNVGLCQKFQSSQTGKNNKISDAISNNGTIETLLNYVHESSVYYSIETAKRKSLKNKEKNTIYLLPINTFWNKSHIT